MPIKIISKQEETVVVTKLSFKHYLVLSLIIIVVNTQGFFPIDEYFPGTIFATIIFLTFALDPMISFNKNEKFKWIGYSVISAALMWIVMGLVGVDYSIITIRFMSLLAVIALGIITKKITYQKNFKTFGILFVIWIVDVVWTAVWVKIKMNSMDRISAGGSPDHELYIMDRFAMGIIFAIEICAILSLVEFIKITKTTEESPTS